MRRKYVVAVLILLGLGVVSTLALANLGVRTVSESIETEYILTYSGSVEIDSTTTTSEGSNHIKLVIDVTQSAANQVQFTIEPCSDYYGQLEITSSGGGDYSVKIVYDGSQPDTTQSATDVTSGEGLGFTITSADTTDLIDYIEIEWTDSNLYTAYWSANINVQDI
ncbi:hypothetical protein JXL21_00860 [Candidatus Bathyarchaeota archaeon]|nr:hypothetical protein [Candidatus Bathyarchaeota archaeon]